MKTYIFISALVWISALPMVNAQTTSVLDTIYANDQKNVALFFPEPIRQGITGSDNFVFTYNREQQQYFGLLQAKPGKESNLLVISKNGAIFSYIVRYKDQLDSLNYFIAQSKSIGNEKPNIADAIKTKAPKQEIEKNVSYYSRFCSYLFSRKQRIGRIKKRNENIVLSVENIVFNKEELYFVIEIENRSSLDYDLNFLKLSIETRKKGKKKSLQRIYREPIFKYNVPNSIAGNKTRKLVYVLPKFSISNDRRVVLELNEKSGERNIKLKISHKYINNPN